MLVKDRPGFVYIARNPAIPGYIKIGRSKYDPRIRMNALSSESVPVPFELVHSVEVGDMVYVESGVKSTINETLCIGVKGMNRRSEWISYGLKRSIFHNETEAISFLKGEIARHSRIKM